MWSPMVESQDNGVALFGSDRVPLLTITEPFTEIRDDSQLVPTVLVQHGPCISETCVSTCTEKGLALVGKFRTGAIVERCFIAANFRSRGWKAL